MLKGMTIKVCVFVTLRWGWEWELLCEWWTAVRWNFDAVQVRSLADSGWLRANRHLKMYGICLTIKSDAVVIPSFQLEDYSASHQTLVSCYTSPDWYGKPIGVQSHLLDSVVLCSIIPGVQSLTGYSTCQQKKPCLFQHDVLHFILPCSLDVDTKCSTWTPEY